MSKQRVRDGCLALAAITVIMMAGALSTASTGEPALKLVQTIELQGKAGKLDHLVVDAKGQRLFLANKVNNTLDIVDLKGAGKLAKQVSGQAGAQGLAYAVDLDRVYVALGTGGFCNIFDCSTPDYKLLETVKFQDDADNVRYNPKTHRVYVAHAENSLGVIDAKTFEVKADIKLPGPAEGFQLETARPRLYLCSPATGEVLLIDTDKNAVVTRYPIKSGGGHHAIALDEANKRIFIGCRKDKDREPVLVVMDTESGKEVATVPIPGDNDDVYYDAKRKRLYASCGEGFVVVIQQDSADSYKLVEKMATVKDAKTSFYDPEAGKLYLAVPRQAGKKGPEIHVYQAP